MSITARLRRRLGMGAAAAAPDLPASASALVLRLDARGALVLVPPGFAALVGVPAETLVGRTLIDLAHPDDAPALAEQLQQLSAGTLPLIEHELRLRAGTGSGTDEAVLWIALAAAPTRGPGAGGLVVTVADISARRQAEERVATSRHLLREALDALPDQLAILDDAGRIIATNRAWDRFTAEHRVGGAGHGVGSTYLRVHEGLGGQDAEHAQLAADGLRAVLSGASSEFTLEYPFGVERRRWFLLRATRMAGSGEARAVVAHQDISERRRATAALADSEARYRTLCQCAGVGIWQIGLDGRTLYLNPAMCDLLEVDSRLDLGSDTFHGFFTAEGLALMEQERGERATGRRSVYEFDLLGRRGAQRRVAVTGAPIMSGADRLTGYIGTFTDISAQHQQAEALREAQKQDALGRLAGGIAHELGNLLTVVLGRSDRLAAGGGGGDLAAVIAATSQAAMLTRQLLAFSRRQVLSTQRRCLNELVRDVGDLLQRVVGPAIQLRFQLEPGLGHAVLDQGRLEQGLVALAAHARAAMPAGGVLTLATANLDLAVPPAQGLVPGGYVSLTLTDTGMPLDATARAHLFEPVPEASQGGDLAALWGLVAQLGGHLSAEALASGTRFQLLLPRCATPLAQPGRSGRRVLLAEDEPALRLLVGEILRDEGWTVVEAADGAEAERLAASIVPDLLITDLVMPQSTGRELATRLRARQPDLPLLFMSGYNPDGWLATREARTAFLAKPFTPQELSAAVRAVMTD